MRAKCMNTFTIDAHNAVARLDRHKHPTQDAEKFSSENELAKLAAPWPASRLVEIWNGMPGVRRVAKFRDRKTAVQHIWTKAQELRPIKTKSTARRDGSKGANVIARPRE